MGDSESVELPGEARIVYSGSRFTIVYLPLDPFYDRLPLLGELLDAVEDKVGEVVDVVPNVGVVTASLLLGTSFQGVKGVAVIARNRVRKP